MIHIQGIPEVAARLAAVPEEESLAKRRKYDVAAVLRAKKRPKSTQPAKAKAA